MLGQRGGGHADQLGAPKCGEGEVLLQLRFLAARTLVRLAQRGEPLVKARKLAMEPEPRQLLTLDRIELPELVVVEQSLRIRTRRVRFVACQLHRPAKPLGAIVVIAIDPAFGRRFRLGCADLLPARRDEPTRTLRRLGVGFGGGAQVHTLDCSGCGQVLFWIVVCWTINHLFFNT